MSWADTQRNQATFKCDRCGVRKQQRVGGGRPIGWYGENRWDATTTDEDGVTWHHYHECQVCHQNWPEVEAARRLDAAVDAAVASMV